MKLSMRLYNDNEDYWRIREFLRQVMLLNNRRDLSWHVTHWDYLMWSFKPDDEKIRLEETVFIWETESGQIAAVLTLKIAGAYSCKSPPLIFAPLNSKQR